MQELISIIMPSYNTGRYIADTIASVQAQTYENWELIIVDDCSTDDTDRVVGPFLEDPRIRYLHNEKNSGAALSRNRALQEARGRWVAFLDSDDLWLPEKLERQVAFMEETGCAFSCTGYREIDQAGKPLGVHVSAPRRITRRAMGRYCWPGCLTVMYDQKALGLLQIADIRRHNDYAMWLKLSRQADCCYLPQTLALYRKGRGGSVSTRGYATLIQWHYKLWREAEGCGPVLSLYHTGVNLVFGLYKKLRYVRREARK